MTTSGTSFALKKTSEGVMFDLITGTKKRPLRERTLGPQVISLVVHALVVTLVIVVPLLRVTNTLPPMPESIVAFVAAARRPQE